MIVQSHINLQFSIDFKNRIDFHLKACKLMETMTLLVLPPLKYTKHLNKPSKLLQCLPFYV